MDLLIDEVDFVLTRGDRQCEFTENVGSDAVPDTAEQLQPEIFSEVESRVNLDEVMEDLKQPLYTGCVWAIYIYSQIGSTITKHEQLVLLLKFQQQFCVSQVDTFRYFSKVPQTQMRHLLELINCMLPFPNQSISSQYFLNKCLDPWILRSNCREYCAECQRLWKEDEEQCPNCADCGAVTFRYKGTEDQQILKRKKSHFLTFSVVEQLQNLLACKL